MIVNPDKYQAIVVERNHQMLDLYPFHILGDDTDSKFTFANHISTFLGRHVISLMPPVGRKGA